MANDISRFIITPTDVVDAEKQSRSLQSDGFSP